MSIILIPILSSFMFHICTTRLSFRLFPYNILYPTGPLSPMSSTSSAACFCIMLILFVTMGDSLALVLLERHFQIVTVTSPNARKLRIQIYTILGFSYISAIFAPIILCLNRKTDSEVTEILISNVENSGILLALQPSLFGYEFSWNFVTIYIIFAVIFFFTYMLFLAGWLMWHNLHYSKTAVTMSKQSKQQFNLMLHTTVVQLITLGVFGFPCIAWVGLLVAPSVPFEYSSICHWAGEFTTLYGIIDVLCVVGVVRSYRNATIKIVTMKYAARKSSIGIMASTFTNIQQSRLRTNSLFVPSKT